MLFDSTLLGNGCPACDGDGVTTSGIEDDLDALRAAFHHVEEASK